MKNVIFSIPVDHLLVIDEEINFVQSFGTIGKAKVVGHTTDPELGNIFTLKVNFLLPFLITQYVFTHNKVGEDQMWLHNRTTTYVELKVNWIAGLSIATRYDVALVGV